MQVIFQPDAAAAAAFTARLMADAIRQNPALVMGLATGRTMEPVYARLVEIHREENLSFSKCTTFNLDEYVGVTPEDPRSYRHTMQTFLFDHVDLRPEATWLPDGSASDIPEACRAYEQAIVEAGGIDLQLLGLGSDGHIGFNEPLSSFGSRTRQICLTPETLQQNASVCGGLDRVPRHALTMGVATITDARRILMLVTGGSKADTVARLVEGPVTTMISGTALHFHPDSVVVVDEEAGSKLKLSDYYRFTFENSPEWENYR